MSRAQPEMKLDLLLLSQQVRLSSPSTNEVSPYINGFNLGVRSNIHDDMDDSVKAELLKQLITKSNILERLIYVEDNGYQTSLHVISNGLTEILKLLLVVPQYKRMWLLSFDKLLKIAYQYNQKEIFGIMISSHWISHDLHHKLMIDTISNKNYEWLKYLIAISPVDTDNSEILIKAIQMDDLSIVKMLIEAGMDPEYPTGLPMIEAEKRSPEIYWYLKSIIESSRLSGPGPGNDEGDGSVSRTLF